MSCPFSVRGSILVQVLVMSAVLVFISATLLRFFMQQSTLAIQAVRSQEAARKTEASLNLIYSAWALKGRTCASNFFIAGVKEVCCYPSGSPRVCDGTPADDSEADTCSWVVEAFPLVNGPRCECAVKIAGANYPIVRTNWSGGLCRLSVAHNY